MTFIRHITSLLALTVVLTNQVAWISVSSHETSRENCACSRSGNCACSHTGGAQKCHANERAGPAEGCFVVAPHHAEATTLIVIQYDPHLLAAGTGLVLQSVARDMASSTSNRYDDIVHPCFVPPPESHLS